MSTEILDPGRFTRYNPLIPGADTASPGQPLPEGTRILCGYVSAPDLPGTPDARHVWTLNEWNLYLDPESPLYGGPELRTLPIFVHDYPGDPVTLANNAVDAMLDLGWAHNLGRLVAVDLETLIDPVYVLGLRAQITVRGFRMMKYGSSGTIKHNPPVDGGTWMALPQAHKPLILPPGTTGVQWSWGPVWDLSLFSQFVYANCGIGPRQQEP